MDPNHPVWSQPAAVDARRRRDAGTIVRIARLAEHLTLAQLGERTGYSASQVSRYERGIAPLTDVGLLHRFATALGIPPQLFGLIPGTDHHRHDAPTPTNALPERVRGPRVVTAQWEDGADPVRRRDLITGAAGLAGTTALGLTTTTRARGLGDPAGGIEQLLYGRIDATPVPLTTLCGAVAQVRGDFQDARYDRLATGLPALIATAAATRDHADGDDRLTANALLAGAYTAASHFMIKLNDDQLAWATADRAAQAALESGDPLTLADARRGVATVMRRTGKATAARDLLIATACGIEPGPHPTPEQLSMYGTLLQVAAYTAAVDGNRAAAHELIGEAAATARRLGADANHRFTSFGPTNVTVFQVSIAQVLGDNGTAIEHATTLRPAAIPTTERRGRYWVDVARAYHQWGKPDRCYAALRSAERAAPAEVRYRPPVRAITEDLLHTDRRRALPGLRAFATRVGVPA